MGKGFEIINSNGRRIVKGTGWYNPDPVTDLKELVQKSVAKFGTKTGFLYRNSSGGITTKNYIQLGKDVDSLGTALVSMGLTGKRIAIISENRYEWSVAFFSIVNGTGIAVPLDKYLPRVEVENLLKRGKCEAIFFSPTYLEMMKGIADTNPLVGKFICFEPIDVADEKFTDIATCIAAGTATLASGERRFVDAVINKDVLSILLFTSGTTNMSKGVMLSHTNIASNITAITTHIHLDEKDVHLSLLPLHHTFENTIGQMLMINRGATIAYCEGIKHVSSNIQEFGVTVLVAVPAILEAIYRKVQDGIEKSGKTKILGILMHVSDFLRKCGIDIRRKLFKSVFAKLGPNLRLAVSGAAPLDKEVIVWFDRIGLTMLQGYGLTETSPVVSACNDFVNVPGTIGYPMAGIEMAIDSPDENGMGEIITRGPNVMLGYYEDEAATKEAIDAEKWFHTGDLGIIDESGLTRITGRAKSMIVLSNGKKAFPEEYELSLNLLPGVKDSFVWGAVEKDGDVKICAKIVLDAEKLKSDNGGILPTDQEITTKLEKAIREMNTNIPQYKILRYFVITEEDLIKTTTLKIKRNPELEKTNKLLAEKGVDMRKANGSRL